MILVVGATGLVGGEICRQLVAAELPVRALVRPTSNQDKVAALRALGVETVEGDVRDLASLIAACSKADAVVCTISSMPFAYQPDVNDIATVDTEGLRNLIDAAETAGVRRFVYTSFSGNIDLAFPLRDAKRTVERWLRSSSLDWTILRPSYFMEVWLSPALGFDPVNGKVTIYGTGDAPISWISSVDVAAFAVACLSDPATSRATIELGGPHPITPLGVVATFETMLGRKIETTFVTKDALLEQQAAATDPMQQSFAGIMRCYAQGDPIEMGRTATMLTRPMTTVRDYAASTRQPVATG